MAQPAYAVKYIGVIRVSKNTLYSTADIIATYPLATVAILKTDIDGDTVNVSIDNSPMCHFSDGEEQFIESGQTFQFSKDCTLKIGIYKVIT